MKTLKFIIGLTSSSVYEKNSLDALFCSTISFMVWSKTSRACI